MSPETVVVGAGLAGLTCALRLAEEGHRVAVVAAGAGSLHLGGGTIDVLGYAPERVESPASALDGFVASHPDHPYAHVQKGLFKESLEWLKDHATSLRLAGSMDENLLLPTAVGAPKPSALAPHALASGDLRRGGRFLLVSPKALKDFYPGLAAANLCSIDGIEARGLELPGTVQGEADPGPLRLARAFDDPLFRAEVAARLKGRIEPGERVGWPAVLGLNRGPEAVCELAERLEAPVFEIATLPPSVPGMRLYALLSGAFKKAGGRIVLGPRVVAGEAEGKTLRAVSALTGARRSEHEARNFVLASGGVTAGGVTMDSSWRFEESVIGLPLAGVPPPGSERFSPDVFGPHPAGRVGVAVDDEWRPLDASCGVVYDNVHVCGATLAGADPQREKSGNGISLVTGYAVADAILRL